MKIEITKITCDICRKEVAEVAGTSMYRYDYMREIYVYDTADGTAYHDICGHCSDAIIAKIEELKP